MSQKAKALLVAGVATVSIAVAPLAGLAVSTGAGVPLACQGGGNGCAG